ncbi:hypothetical protein Back11_32080 [Paenibacillus baekrokdamisoli]|uniref:Uncharacterized protein n=1 Tax=Paenibacillus baekrokdamisoli TaxID=1712516 RepID=A0A3G9JAF1_9BACL|nr:GDSL-type esterase/lipase family protein [Paenibacillus baekrokdamisoli]MBB3071627.1 lysophospholipase L1-like esterase [Paenibacillus baekrokdamisoli]BBH21863.1 hypothetical protein Back11_32080 [Paenibacillus baekrokdamisoli]
MSENVKQTAESLVFTRQEKQQLRHRPIIKGSVKLRTHTDPEHVDAVAFVEGKDFIVDYDSGVIVRAEGSSILDWSDHVLYEKVNFDHTLFDDYSNRNFTVFIDYEYELDRDAAKAGFGNAASHFLKNTINKLQSGQEAVYVVYGDSISTGGEASEERYAYFQRLANRLSTLSPAGNVRVVNKAIGGETSTGGSARVEQDVVANHPDLLTIGYGMNDQNLFEGKVAVPLHDYEQNIRNIIEATLRNGETDIVLVTPCEPNPLWKHTSGQVGEFAQVLRRLGVEYKIGVADVNEIWKIELNAGKTPESLLLNNINHPNDYGHWLYEQAFNYLIEGTGAHT